MNVVVSSTHVMRMQTVQTLWAAIFVTVKWDTLEMERHVQMLMSVPVQVTCVIKMQPVPILMAATHVNVMKILWEMDMFAHVSPFYLH